jgi:uncharacterized membrane protein YfcA
MIEVAGFGAMALVAAAIGVLGGLGGAVLLVPALVVVGVSPAEAAPLGLVTVAAGSIAAAPRQLADRSVNHRIGVSTELVSSTGAVIGAVGSGLIGDRALTYALAAVALGAALAGGRRSGLRNPPDPDCQPSDIGERIGSLSGAYPLGKEIVPYQARRLPLAMVLMGVSGLIAGVAGASGGFIKTPATTEIMTVPTKVAASTTTFTVGVTASTALVVFALQGRIEPRTASFVVAGSLLGGLLGARVQSSLHPARVRRALSVVLVTVAIVLVTQA